MPCQCLMKLKQGLQAQRCLISCFSTNICRNLYCLVNLGVDPVGVSTQSSRKCVHATLMTFERVKGLKKIQQFLQLRARLFDVFKPRDLSTRRPAEFTQQMGSNEAGTLHSSTSKHNVRLQKCSKACKCVPPVRVLQLIAPPPQEFCWTLKGLTTPLATF